MTQDEIRKLLGGYATDALTPDERRMLFQAALEDQELFTALANEDALKELLDDPVTRARLRVALQPRRRQFHPRRWLLGVAIPAVVAAVLVVMMNRAGAPRFVATDEAKNEVSTPPAVTAPAPAPAPSAAAAAPKPRALKHAVRIARPQPPPAPESIAALARPNAVTPAVAPALPTLRAAPSIPSAILRQLDEGFRSDAPLYQGPLVQYAVMRSGPEGRAIRVQVTTGIAGYLALFEVDAAGRAIRVYPTGEGAAHIVVPNVPVQIPPEPIEIAQAGTKLRLVLVRVPMPRVNGFLPGTQGAAGGAEVQATPLVVEIPLAR